MTRVLVMGRVRPSNNYSDYHVYTDNKINRILIDEPKKDVALNNYNKFYKYDLDKTYDEFAKNEHLYNDFGLEIAENLINKKNSTFYVFGQTGSGKTHTILGNSENKVIGILEYILNYLNSKNLKFKINCIQIYNNCCYDIFNNNKKIKQREDSKGKINLCGVKSMTINYNIKLILEIIKLKRNIGISGQNNQSSRSHLLIQINNGNSFLKILDLAGSERAKKSLFINKKIFRENGEINKSILVLKECIRALKNNKKYIPYRGSKLTKILKSSFHKHSNTYILATLSPEKENIKDSINILNYVSDIKKIKRRNNNMELSPIKNVPKFKNKLHLSPKYKYLLNNKGKINKIESDKNRLINLIVKKKTTKNDKIKLCKIIDRQLTNLEILKNKLNN